MPACSKSALLYQKPTTPTENGSPYVLPSTCQPATEPPIFSIVVGGRLGDVLDQAGLDLVGELAAAPLHVDVRRVAGLERGVELGEHVLVLHRADLDGHAGVRGLEVGGDLLVVVLAVAVVGVVPPGEGRRVAGGAVGRVVVPRRRELQAVASRAMPAPSGKGARTAVLVIVDLLVVTDRAGRRKFGTRVCAMSIVIDNVFDTNVSIANVIELCSMLRTWSSHRA